MNSENQYMQNVKYLFLYNSTTSEKDAEEQEFTKILIFKL